MADRTKIILLDERFSTGEPTVQPVLLWGSRSKPFYERMSKEASASPALDYIRSVQPVPGRTIVLIIGLGSFEFYGLNRNGDGFNEEPYKMGQKPTCGCCGKGRDAWLLPDECIQHHYQSYEHGHVYRHHVNKDPKRSVGKVLKAFWNPFMHRVEVLEDIENDKAPDLVERICDGEFPAKSMGCRIKFDVCTKCGHCSPTRKEYCDHCKFEIGQLDPHTGIRNGTLNPAPKFFDSSWVFKPADRTGYMLKKVAEHAYEIRNSSELGEVVDSLNAKAAAAKKVAVIDKLVRGYPAAVVQSELPEANLIQHYCGTSLPTVVEKTQELPMKDLESLAPHNIGHTLAALSRAGIILTTPEFIRLFMAKAAPGTDVPSDVLDNLTAMQGEIFELFGQHPSLLEDTTAAFNTSGAGPASPELRKTVQSLLEKRSTLGEYVQRRLTPWAFRMEEPALSDVLEVPDPTSGRTYQTTRGAVRAAHDEIAKSQLKRLVGGAGLLAAASKIVTTSPGLALPLLAGSVYLGKTGLEPMPSYKSTTGEDVPYLTEFQEKRSSVLDLVNVLGQDYRVTKHGALRLRSAQRGAHPDRHLHHVLKKLSSFGLDSQGESLERMVISSKQASDGIRDEPLDFEKVADVLGTLAWNEY